MNRTQGFAVPIVLLLTLLFLVLPLIFWYSLNNSSKEQVKGASIEKDESSVPVKIVSPANTWDLQQYLCTDKKECVSSLYSGKRYITTSGGSTHGHYVTLSRPSVVDDYKYLKVFAQSNNGNSRAEYYVSDSDLLVSHSIEVTKLKEGSHEIDVVLIPLEFFANTTGAIESINFITK